MIVTVSLTAELGSGESDSHINYSVAFGDIDGKTVTVEQFKKAVYDAMRGVDGKARQTGWVV